MKKKISIFLLIFAVMIIFTNQLVGAGTASISLGANQNVQYTNTTGSSFTISSTSKFDYAKYGSYNYVDYGKDMTSVTLYSNERIVITNAGTAAITMTASNSSFAPTSTANPALCKGTLLAGKNYEFKSTNTLDISIENNSSSTAKFDYAAYASDGSYTISKDCYGVSSYINVKSNGRTVVSVSGGNISYWSAYDNYNNYVVVGESQYPALRKDTFLSGKNYELKNSYTKSVPILNNTSSTLKIDYAAYNANGTVNSYKANDYGSSLSVVSNAKTNISVLNGNIEYAYAYDMFIKNYITVSEIQTPALYKGTLVSGKNYEFLNPTSARIGINNNSSSTANFDYVRYKSDGTVYFFSNKTFNTELSMDPNEKTVVSVLTANISFWYPYDNYGKDFSFNEAQNPALYKGTLLGGKNYEFKSTNATDVSIQNNSSSTAKFDYAAYASDGGYTISKDCYGYNSNINVQSNGRTVVTIIGGNIEYCWPYGVYNDYIVISESQYPALKKDTLLSGKNYEFKNSYTKSTPILNNTSSTLKIDYASYNSNGSVNKYDANYYGSSFSVSSNGKTVVSVLNGNIDYAYAYDIFNNKYLTVSEVQTPALIKGTLSSGKNYEFLNMTDATIGVKNNSSSTASIDYVRYKSDGNVNVYFCKTVSSELSMDKDEKIAISVLTANVIYWYPYDNNNIDFLLNEIQNPAIFKTVLTAGKTYSIDTSKSGTVNLNNDSSSTKKFNCYCYNADGALINTTNNMYSYIEAGKQSRVVLAIQSSDINFYYPYGIYDKGAKPILINNYVFNFNQTLKVGDYVQFGTYMDPIIWRVIDADPNKVLLFSDKIVSFNAFDANSDDVDYDGDKVMDTNSISRRAYGSNYWEKSNIREWLNSDQSQVSFSHQPPYSNNLGLGADDYSYKDGFLYNFTQAEKDLICPVEHSYVLSSTDFKVKSGGEEKHKYNPQIANSIQNYDSSCYKTVTDKVFLLNIKELYNLVYSRNFEVKKKPMQATIGQYDFTKGYGTTNNTFCSYWLRDAYSNFACYERIVGNDGRILYYPSFATIGIAPAMYIKPQAYMSMGNGSKDFPYIVVQGVQN